jgi:hypothetical protein
MLGERGFSLRCIITRQKNEKFEDSIADFADEERGRIYNLRNP